MNFIYFLLLITFTVPNFAQANFADMIKRVEKNEKSHFHTGIISLPHNNKTIVRPTHKEETKKSKSRKISETQKVDVNKISNALGACEQKNVGDVCLYTNLFGFMASGSCINNSFETPSGKIDEGAPCDENNCQCVPRFSNEMTKRPQKQHKKVKPHSLIKVNE